jgi:hypothetical protein
MSATLTYSIRNPKKWMESTILSDDINKIRELFPTMCLSYEDIEKLQAAYIVSEREIYLELQALINQQGEIELEVTY